MSKVKPISFLKFRQSEVKHIIDNFPSPSDSALILPQ